METVTGRGGIRSGRAVVGLDVISHTLPRNYRTSNTSTTHPQPSCCPPTPPEEVDEEEICSEPGCMECHLSSQQQYTESTLLPTKPRRQHDNNGSGYDMSPSERRLRLANKCSTTPTSAAAPSFRSGCNYSPSPTRERRQLHLSNTLSDSYSISPAGTRLHRAATNATPTPPSTNSSHHHYRQQQRLDNNEDCDLSPTLPLERPHHHNTDASTKSHHCDLSQPPPPQTTTLSTHPDVCSGHLLGDPQCPDSCPYSSEGGGDTYFRPWDGGDTRHSGGGTTCITCSLEMAPPSLPPPCTCPDPSCVGSSVLPPPLVPLPPCHCACPPHPHTLSHSPPAHRRSTASHDSLSYLPRASSDCTLPKLLSMEERLTTALGRQHYHHQHHDDHHHAHAHIHTHHALTRRPHPPHHHHPHSHPGSRLSRSLENLPKDIKEHILKCQCSCDHLGYGNFSATSLHHLPGLSNGCSSHSTKSGSREDLPHAITHLKHKHKGGWLGVEVPAQVWGGVCLVLVVAGVAGVGVSVPLALRVDPSAALPHRVHTARALLRDTPLVDGHNDLPWNIRKFMHNKLHSFNFSAELQSVRPWSRSSWSHTDLPRLREGVVGAQFWVSYVPCESQRLNAVQLTIEQIDLIKRLIEQYPQHLSLATSADEVETAFQQGRIASLIGVEGGHAIQNSLGVLRALRDLGVRYLTLTHTCSTPWAECARAKESDLEDPNSPRGLTHFGKTVVREMNRLGLLVDLSHVSQATMRAALKVSRAPVIFSHSSVYALCRNPRNVPDDILKQVAINGGVVMVSFYTHFLTCSETAGVSDVVNHINHVRNLAGVDHVGIGADFDGVNKLPEGLEDVSRYPRLFAELLADASWSMEDLKKLAGQNLLRVMRDVEKVRETMGQQGAAPLEEEVPPSQLPPANNCTYNFTKGADD